MMPIKPTPRILDDRTITAMVAKPAQQFTATRLLTLRLPDGVGRGLASGCYFLARCGAQTDLERAENWQMYLRRPLFVVMPASGADENGCWEFALASNTMPGDRWLGELEAGATINLLGPLGRGFTLQPLSRNLLLLADFAHAPLLLASIDPMLNRGGQVTLLLRTVDKELNELRTRLPIPVELRLAATEDEWQQQLAETIRWADQICAVLPTPSYTALAVTTRNIRFRLDANFAQVFVHADLACGVGACLACVTPLHDGSYTRVCIHGPVFDLARLAGPG
jgi:dihydroorotate dehydrogenase electron transfer subunit